ncbi:hypothetical protein WN51_12634 [Melipona quadrifasciata]|uniref:Uncharacterized protein n=1 Tax=Melipona quadrifasciata TaxID=166423 RepID=A0A0M9A0P1_9HYME|nr:hypothetical protein WN51_12634 [Melipona quadrifasciata]
MEESSDKHEQSCTLKSANENGLSIDKATVGIDSLDSNRTNDQSRTKRNEESWQIVDENSSPSRSKECVTGIKVKRKLRSTRRKLNAMINNTSLHFSDTDSEGELTSIQSCPIRPLSHTANEQQGPIISVTYDDVEVKGSDLLSPTDDKEPSLRSNFVENLTDVDEIYPSDPETEQKENQNNLKVAKSLCCQGDTDLEDLEGEDEVDSTIYVKPRSDIFCDYSGETITTKEGDGPFSIEVRNKLYREEQPRNELFNGKPDIVIMSNTDEEEMDVSEEEDGQEACCSQKELLEDFDVLVASQVIMKNINKMENMLTVRDISDDGTSDCHTDVEEVDPNE